MKTLLLMRHAKSSWADNGLEDHDRPLNGRGERDAPRMGEWLAAKDLLPDLIITSTALRARQTAQAVQLSSGTTSDLLEFPELYHAGVKAWTTVIRQVPDAVDCLLSVGHNPGLEELVSILHVDWERMPTAAIAWFELTLDTWSEFAPSVPATLKTVWRPKELEDAA